MTTENNERTESEAERPNTDTDTDTIDADTDKRLAYIMGLRELALFLMWHPEVKLPSTTEINIFGATQAELIAGARAFGQSEKIYSNDYFTLRKAFPGGIHLDFFCDRAKVCERRVVGQRTVPEHVIPAQAETVVPEHVEDIVEWDCVPLLDHAARTVTEE